ncbi:hypothetical protein PA598K_01229 [Paenibacillus sp. 598K]|nr:hypothetical protein PA598K_01229 [Paenibacillus sp. 598K]
MGGGRALPHDRSSGILYGAASARGPGFLKYSLGLADNDGYGALACLLLPQDKLDAAWRAELLAE